MHFNTLPTELQCAILDFALPDLESEVCIIWGPENTAQDCKPVLPLLVDTAFPVVMHVCRAWRA
jgi:hypothetical protein